MKKQIKQVRIDVDTKGAKEAQKAIDGINSELKGLQDTAKAVGGYLKGPSKSLESLYTRATALSPVFSSLVADIKQMNTALNGNTKKAEVGLSGYMDNLDLLSISLQNVVTQSSKAATNLGKIDASLGTSGTSDHLEDMLETLTQIVLELKDLNVGSRVTTARLKDVRGGVHDLGATADRTEEEIQELGSRTNHTGESFDGLGVKVRDVDNRLKNFNKHTGSSTARSFSKMAFGTNYLTLLYAKLAINVYAVSEAFRYLSDAASFGRLQEQVAGFSAAVSGINVKSLAADMQELGGYALSLKESLEFATKGVAFNFTTEQLEDLTVGARKASIALGLNFTDAMDRVLRGISKQEIELFDELGVVTRLTPAFRKYAVSVNKTVSELSDYERQLAVTDEVQRQLDTRFSGVEIASTGWEKLGKVVQDFSNNSLKLVAQSLDGVALELAELLTPTKDVTDSVKTLGDSLATVEQAKGPGIFITSVSELGSALEVANRELAIAQSSSDSLASVGWTALGISVAAVGAAFLVYTFGAVAATAATTALVAVVAVLASPLTLAAAAAAAFGYALVQPVLLQEKLAANREKEERRLHRVAAAQKVYSEALKKTEDLGIDLEATRAEAVRRHRAEIDELRDKYALASEAEKAGILKQIALIGTVEQRYRALLAERGVAVKQATADMTDAQQSLLGFADTSGKVVTSFTDGLTEVSKFTKGIASNFGGGEISASSAESLKQFKELNESLIEANKGSLPDSIKNFKDLEAAMLKAHIATDQLAHSGAVLAQQSTLAGDDTVRSLEGRVKQLEEYRKVLATLGPLSAAQQKENKEALELLKLQLQIAKENKRQQLASNTLAFEHTKALESTSHIYKDQSELLWSDLGLARRKHELVLSNLNLSAEARKELELIRDRELEILRIKKGQAEVQEEILAKLSSNKRSQNLGVIGIEERAHQRARVGSGYNAASENQDSQDLLGLKISRSRSDISAKGGEEGMGTVAYQEAVDAVDALVIAQTRLKELKPRAAMEDWAAGMAAVAAVDGLDSATSNMINSAGDFGKALFEISESFALNNENLLSNLADAVQSGASIAAEAVATLSDAKVADIDRQIAAEKRKDGESAKSLAKIKSLETKKIKEKAKADKVAVVMSTGVAIMRAFSDLGWPGGIPAAAIAAGMGALQISNINKAESGSIASLSTGADASMSITGGTRDNSVDVSKVASAGEFAFASGQSDIVPGRAGGGYSSGGTSIMVGEAGPEIITPAVPVNVTNAGNSKGTGATINFSPVFNATAVDASGMSDMFNNYSKELYDGLQRELAANNQTLESL